MRLPWARHYFKDNKQKVWVEVDADGKFVVDERGRPQIRYQNKEDAKTYRVQASHVKGLAASSAKSKEAAKASTSVKKPKKASGSAPDEPGDVIRSTDVPQELLSLELPDEDLIEVYTDGACQGNPGPCSYGVLIRFNSHYIELSQYLGKGTNNIGELTAIKASLEALKRYDLPVRVHTDSSYAIGVLTKNWKAKANQALIAETKGLLKKFDDVELIKVKGHSGLPLNERVDALAVDAIEQAKVPKSKTTSTLEG